MKLALTVTEQTFEAEYKEQNGTATLTAGQTTHTAHITMPEPGLRTIIINNHVYRCFVDELPGGHTEIVVNGQRFPVSVFDKKQRRGNAAGGANASGKAAIIAPMPGKVVRVLAAVGDEIAANQSIMVVEAMKMQNEVQAPKAGKLTQLMVSEGQTVNAGETLAVIE